MHRNRRDGLSSVAGDILYAVTIIQAGLEDLDLLLGDDGSPHPADEFLGLATKHASANDFDSPLFRSHRLGFPLQCDCDLDEVAF